MPSIRCDKSKKTTLRAVQRRPPGLDITSQANSGCQGMVTGK